jgi:hypothetical protein
MICSPPRSDFTQASCAFEREWLVTNALGGFACGTVALANAPWSAARGVLCRGKNHLHQLRP